MTIANYTHVIRELKGLPRVSAQKQIEVAREHRQQAGTAGVVD